MNRYIYIDDETDETTSAIKDGLNDTGIIHVDLEKPQAFEAQSEDLLKKLSSYNGIILDLRLDDNPQSEAKYTAPPLAQALRTNASVNIGKQDCPIILCSTDAKIKKSYLSDQSSHDLFDYKFLKDDEPNWGKIAKKLDSLAHGYKMLSEKNEISNYINRDFKDLDPRIFDRFLDNEILFPPHEYARFIVKEFLGQPGPLINEKLLAARLGIDISESKDWDAIKSKVFQDASYTGVFSDAWDRWWADKVNIIFKTFTNKRLASLNAKERVDLIISNTGFQQLKVAELIPRSVSSNYWTICEFYKKPLDPLEGFKIHTQREPKAWQELRYISVDAAVERKGMNKGLKVHLSELERLEKVKLQLKEKEK